MGARNKWRPGLHLFSGTFERLKTGRHRFYQCRSTICRKVDDPQGGVATMLMQQVREVMTVSQEMADESSWIWLTSEQMGFPLRSEIANENHGESESSKQYNQCTDQTAFFWRLSSQISFETLKENSIVRSSKMRLKCQI